MMCRYNSAVTIYNCGAVEHVERKNIDCKRRHCINSKKHPWNCARQPFIQWLRELISYGDLQTEHAPACREYHEITYSFANSPHEQCCDRSCNFLQNQNDPGFKEAVRVIREDTVARVNAQERAERDAASTRLLRDEPM